MSIKESVTARGLKLTIEPAFFLRRWVGPFWPLTIEGQRIRYRLAVKRERDDGGDKWLDGSIILDVNFAANREVDRYASVPVPDLAVGGKVTIPLPVLFTHTPGHIRFSLRDRGFQDHTYFMYSYHVARGDLVFLRVLSLIVGAALLVLGAVLDRNRDRLWPFDTGSDATPIATMTPLATLVETPSVTPVPNPTPIPAGTMTR